MAPRPINQPPNPFNAIEIDDNASEVSIATASTNREILAATRFLACQAFLRQLWVGHLTATGQIRLIEPAHGDVIVNGDDDIQEVKGKRFLFDNNSIGRNGSKFGLNDCC